MVSDTTTQGASLKSCPFCGAAVTLEEAQGTHHPARCFWGVVCRGTGNKGGSCAIQQRPSASPEAAIERWNHRAQHPAPQGPSDAELEAARAAFDWDGWTDPKAAQRGFAREVLARWGAAPQPPDDLLPEFTDTARAALLCVLWHHQGAGSPVGQAIRFALGMGQHDRLEPHQLAEAKRWERLHPLNPSVWAPRLRPLPAERIEAIWVEHGLDDCDPEGFARRIEADHGITGAPDGDQQT